MRACCVCGRTEDVDYYVDMDAFDDTHMICDVCNLTSAFTDLYTVNISMGMTPDDAFEDARMHAYDEGWA